MNILQETYFIYIYFFSIYSNARMWENILKSKWNGLVLLYFSFVYANFHSFFALFSCAISGISSLCVVENTHIFASLPWMSQFVDSIYVKA